jgi:hypothetical protein
MLADTRANMGRRAGCSGTGLGRRFKVLQKMSCLADTSMARRGYGIWGFGIWGSGSCEWRRGWFGWFTGTFCGAPSQHRAEPFALTIDGWQPVLYCTALHRTGRRYCTVHLPHYHGESEARQRRCLSIDHRRETTTETTEKAIPQPVS